MVGALARGGRGEGEDAESEGRGQDAYTRAGKLSGFYLTRMEKHRFGLARKTNGRLQGDVGMKKFTAVYAGALRHIQSEQ
jgi:hypothetical protein